MAAPAPVDLDLDLDFSIGDDEPTTAPSPAAGCCVPATTLALNVPPAAEPMPALDMDFGSATVALEPPRRPRPRSTCPRCRRRSPRGSTRLT